MSVDDDIFFSNLIELINVSCGVSNLFINLKPMYIIQRTLYNVQCKLYTARPLLSAVLGRIKFWSQKPRIIEVRLIEA